jgi:hypothetical protein
MDEHSLTPSDRPTLLVVLGHRPRWPGLPKFLIGCGFEVVVVPGGLDAIDYYLEHTGQVAAVLLDADLPDLPGSAFQRRLRPHFPGLLCCYVADDPDSPNVADLVRESAVLVSPPTPLQNVAQVLWELLGADRFPIRLAECVPA